MTLPQHLSSFLDGRPALKVTRRSDEGFDAAKQVFVASPDVPLAVIRPQSADDVAALVAHLSANSVPLVVRVGGHDLSARSVAQDAVQIDLRDLKSVRVAQDKRSARIGGGILTQDLLDALATEGLMAACGNSGSVGWCSWAMNGGYGIMAGKYGLGCDQILGATVVLADGRIVDADERLLKAIRGAGTAFGVVVELEIKVYPLTEIVGGAIACDSTNLGASLSAYFDNCRSLIEDVKTLPAELYFQPMIMTPPGAPSAIWIVHFIWAGPPSEEQAKWLEKVVSISPGGQAAVAPATPADYTRQFTKMGAHHVQGGQSRSVSMRSLVPSPAAAAAIAKQAPLITPGWGAMFIHMVHGESVSSDRKHPASVFPSREVHLMVEILGFAFADPGSNPAAAAWCQSTHEAFEGVDGVMDEAYFPLMQSSILNLEKTFRKEDLDFLRAIKKEYDPTNVFFNPMPLAK